MTVDSHSDIPTATAPEADDVNVVLSVPDSLDCWDAIEALVASLPDPATLATGTAAYVYFKARDSGWLTRFGFGKRSSGLEAAVACTALLRRGYSQVRVHADRGLVEGRVR